jgi:hypothetical protein
MAYITYEKPEVAYQFHETWSMMFMKHYMRVYPMAMSTDEYKRRSAYSAKLTNLPRGTTTVDLLDVLQATNAKTCVIPKGNQSYQNLPYAYLTFESEKDLNAAFATAYSLLNNDLHWCTIEQKTCRICGSPEHIRNKCKKNLAKQNNKYAAIYKRYQPSNYEKLLPKSRQRTNNQNRRPWNEANLQPGRTFADATKNSRNNHSSILDGLNDPTSNINNTSRSNSSPAKTGYTPSSAFERAMMDRFDNIETQFATFMNRLNLIEERLTELEFQWEDPTDANLRQESEEPKQFYDPDDPSSDQYGYHHSDYDTPDTSSAMEHDNITITSTNNMYAVAKRNSAAAQLTSNDESSAVKALRTENERLRLQNIRITNDQKRELDEYKKQLLAEVQTIRSDVHAAAPNNGSGSIIPSSRIQ